MFRTKFLPPAQIGTLLLDRSAHSVVNNLLFKCLSGQSIKQENWENSEHSQPGI